MWVVWGGALGARGFLDTNMLVKAIEYCLIGSLSQDQAPTRMGCALGKCNLNCFKVEYRLYGYNIQCQHK